MHKRLLLNYGRNALRYIIKTYGIKEIYIPYYLCDVVRHSVLKENCKPIFYHIDDNFLPTIAFPVDAYILYPNYFGICDKNVEMLVQKYPNMIIDNSHSFYSKPQGFACFNSIRKFQPTYYGSELYIKNTDLQLDYQKEIDITKYKTIDEYENCISNILPLFVQNNLKIKNDKEERLKIFNYCHENLSAKNQLKIDIQNIFSPFCYPYLAKTKEEADRIANQFMKNGITIYRYWKNLPKNYSEYKFYRQLVPIPLNQPLKSDIFSLLYN